MSSKTKHNQLVRVEGDSQPFMAHAHWSCIQSEGHTFDDGRLASLRAHAEVSFQGRWAIYYYDNGSIFIGASNVHLVELARAFIHGWRMAASRNALV
jgi:hypothetical protein